jgi:integrase
LLTKRLRNSDLDIIASASTLGPWGASGWYFSWGPQDDADSIVSNRTGRYSRPRRASDLSMFLRVLSASACRRGEILALRWSDMEDDGHATIARSLTQTNDGLKFKSTETDNP